MVDIVNVPNVAGIPSVIFNAAGLAADAASTLLTGDLVTSFGSGPQQWGLYSGGAPVVTADSVLTMEYKQEWAVCDYPVEEGGFASYNKVQIPYDGRFRFAAGGTQAARSALLSSIAAIAGTLHVYDLVTPDAVYPNLNVIHYDYKRTNQSGNGLLMVDVWCQEIRQAGASSSNAFASLGGVASALQSVSGIASSISSIGGAMSALQTIGGIGTAVQSLSGALTFNGGIVQALTAATNLANRAPQIVNNLSNSVGTVAATLFR